MNIVRLFKLCKDKIALIRKAKTLLLIIERRIEKEKTICFNYWKLNDCLSLHLFEG